MFHDNLLLIERFTFSLFTYIISKPDRFVKSFLKFLQNTLDNHIFLQIRLVCFLHSRQFHHLNAHIKLSFPNTYLEVLSSCLLMSWMSCLYSFLTFTYIITQKRAECQVFFGIKLSKSSGSTPIISFVIFVCGTLAAIQPKICLLTSISGPIDFPSFLRVK